MRHSLNLPLPPRIPSFKRLCATVAWDTPGIHSFSQNLPGKPTPLLNIYTRASQNLLLPPRIYPSLFLQCDSHRIYPSLLPEKVCMHTLEGIHRAYIYHP